MWHPAGERPGELHEERQGDRVSRPSGYDPPDESHFTSRHYWEVGELDTPDALGLDGALPGRRPANPATRCRACRWTTRSRRRWRRTKMPVAAVSSPADYNMWAYGLDEPVIGPALRTFGELGALNAPSPAYAQARGASLDTSIVLNQMAAFVQSQGKSTYQPAVSYPTAGGEFPARLAALAAMLGAGLPIKCASLTAVGSYDTHSDEPDTLEHEPRRDGRIGARVPARSRTARRWPTGC